MAVTGIGDDVIVTGHVRELYDVHRRKIRVGYERERRWEMFDNNPKIAAWGEKGDFPTYMPRKHGLRPYCKSKSNVRWMWVPYRPPRGEVFLSDAERKFAAPYRGRVVFGNRLKEKAPPNKDWGAQNWARLADEFGKLGGLRPLVIGRDKGVPVQGTEFVATENPRLAAALISVARAVVTQEGLFHHVAEAFRVPTIVIYGGYVSPAVTGYDDQINLFVGDDLGCGWRTPCAHCAEAMAKIPSELVFEKLRGLLDGAV